MALLSSLPPCPNTLAYRCAIDKSWFMSPSLWTRHVVTAIITDTGNFSNNLNYRCLVFLQEIEVLRTGPPSCRACNQNYSPLVERTIERKARRGKEKLESKASQKNKRDKEARCSTCFNRTASLLENTNSKLIRNIPAFLHLHVLMNADYNHDTAKKTVSECYGVTRKDTLCQWVVWILELTHVYVWHEGGHTLGEGIPIPIKQLTIDETFWQ